MIMGRKRDLITEISIGQIIGNNRNVTMSMNVLIHHLAIEGTNGGAMVGMMITSCRWR